VSALLEKICARKERASKHEIIDSLSSIINRCPFLPLLRPLPHLFFFFSALLLSQAFCGITHPFAFCIFPILKLKASMQMISRATKDIKTIILSVVSAQSSILVVTTQHQPQTKSLIFFS
jgi:hypothetical protein